MAWKIKGWICITQCYYSSLKTLQSRQTLDNQGILHKASIDSIYWQENQRMMILWLQYFHSKRHWTHRNCVWSYFLTSLNKYKCDHSRLYLVGIRGYWVFYETLHYLREFGNNHRIELSMETYLLNIHV